MSTYKSVQNRAWFDKLYNLDHADVQYSLVDVAIDTQHVNTCILDWMMMMEDNGQFDDFLLMEYKEQFGDWSMELLSASDWKIRKALKELFRARGIYLPLNAKETITEQLFAILTFDTCPVWPEKELALAMIDPNFKCRQMGTMKSKRSTGSRPATPPRPPPLPPPPPANTQPPGVRALTDLSKLYNDELRFTGDLHDVFNLKLNIFHDLCTKAGVTTDQYSTAFGTMLRGKAQTYYYQHLAGKGLTFVELCERIRAYFHTAENHQHFLNEWRAIMLRDIITTNPDKTLPQCLEITIERLQRTYLGLTQNFGTTNEMNLAGQLVSACQGVAACSQVLVRPAATFEAVASELRSAVGIWSRCHPNQQYVTHSSLSPANDSAFYTDRRYNRSARYDRNNRNDKGRNSYPRHNSNNDRQDGFQGGSNNGRGRGNYTQHDKKCFVCGNQGCWSTRHSTEERAQSRRRFQTYTQDHDDVDPDYHVFLATYEGIDEGNSDSQSEDNNDLDTFYNACTYQSQFNTSTCGPIDGQVVTTALNNAATIHAITGIDPYKHEGAQEATHLFTFDTRYGAEIFQGIMPDTGAAGISTAGKTQVMALQQLQHLAIDTSTAGRHRIRFGDNPECISIGDVKVKTPFGTILFAVMPTNTPFLLCLADMDKHGIYLNNVDNVLVHHGNQYPVVRKWGHPWLLLDHHDTVVHYLTETELRQLHRRFGHPAADRMYKVLEKAGHNDVDKEVITKINKLCHQCQMHSTAPGRFKFTIRDDVDFNSHVVVDVMYIDQKPVLHAVDEATSFQAARFLTDIKATTTWDTLRAMWIDMYVGPPDLIATDAGKNFVGKEFVDSAASLSIEVKEVPVEAHNSIGKVERYHVVIRRAFEIITSELGTSTTMEHRLQMAVKAVNDTAGPDGLVPTLLVFGTYPRLAKTSLPSPSIAARATAVHKAMSEIRKLKAARQVQDALATRNGPSVTKVLLLPLQSDVKVWRENKGWTGPHTLLGLNPDSTAAIVEINGKPITFRTTVVHPYYHDDGAASPRLHEKEHDDDINGGDDNYVPEQPPPRRGRGRPKGSKNKPKIALSAMTALTGLVNAVHLTQREQDDLVLAQALRSAGKITTPGQPFETSTQTEISALIERGVFKFEIYNPNIHGGNRIFKSRIVNEVKGKMTDQPYEKSRLVIQGYNDSDKALVLTQSPTIQRSSQRLIIALAPSLTARGMMLWLRDITQAYTQSDDLLQRTIIADLPVQLRQLYPSGTIMVVIKPLYGIAEAGTYWWSTYFKHHTDKLEMETSTYDPCLLISRPTAAGVGIVGIQTDDTLGLSDAQFAAKEKEELRFNAKEKEVLTKDNKIDFNGCVVTTDGNTISLLQKRQGEKLEAATDQKSYIQQRARGAYIASICQPEASFDLAAAAQTTTDPTKEEISRLNKRIIWQKQNVDRGLSYVQLKITDLKLFAFVDASFANNKDMSSQMGYVIVLGNEFANNTSSTIRGNIIHWSSLKCKRITRSVLASEIYAMAHGVDIAIAIGSTLNVIMDRLSLPHVPIVICTDSLSLYECLVKLGTTKEKRLMIDIMALREAYERGELKDIRWIDGSNNPADAMTKATANASMEQLINTNELELRVQGWVNRATRETQVEEHDGDSGTHM